MQETYLDDPESVRKAAGRIAYAFFAELVWFFVGFVSGALSIWFYAQLVHAPEFRGSRLGLSGFIIALGFGLAGALTSGSVAAYCQLNQYSIGEHNQFESRVIVCSAFNVGMMFMFVTLCHGVGMQRHFGGHIGG